MNFEKGFISIKIVLAVLVLVGIGVISYYLLNNKFENKKFNQIEKVIYKNIILRNIDNSTNCLENQNCWDRKIIGIDQDDKEHVLAESAANLIGLKKLLYTNFDIFTFNTKNQILYFFTVTDGTELYGDCYSFNVQTLEIKKSDISCFPVDVYVISPNGNNIAYYNMGDIYIFDIANKKTSSVVTPLQRDLYGQTDQPDFKWIDNNTLQYPVYDKDYKLINIKTINFYEK